MRQRWHVLVALVASLVLLGAVSVQANVSPYSPLTLNRQSLGLIGSCPATSSTSWRAVCGWGFSDGPVVNLRGGLAATLSVTVSGAPVQFRILLEVESDNFRVLSMKPTAVSFDPGASAESFSFTFVAKPNVSGNCDSLPRSLQGFDACIALALLGEPAVEPVI